MFYTVLFKWFANLCFVLATVSLLSPSVASTSIFPWVAFLLGNIIWVIDSFSHKNWPWLFMALFFTVWDILLIFSRLCGIEFFGILSPLIKVLEMLP